MDTLATQCILFVSLLLFLLLFFCFSFFFFKLEKYIPKAKVSMLGMYRATCGHAWYRHHSEDPTGALRTLKEQDGPFL